MKHVLVGLILMGLTGCSLFVKEVKTPVWVCPAPPERSVLELKLDSLTPQSSTDEALSAMLSDIILLRGQNEELINDLKVYKQPPETLHLLPIR